MSGQSVIVDPLTGRATRVNSRNQLKAVAFKRVAATGLITLGFSLGVIEF